MREKDGYVLRFFSLFILPSCMFEVIFKSLLWPNNIMPNYDSFKRYLGDYLSKFQGLSAKTWYNMFMHWWSHSFYLSQFPYCGRCWLKSRKAWIKLYSGFLWFTDTFSEPLNVCLHFIISQTNWPWGWLSFFSWNLVGTLF